MTTARTRFLAGVLGAVLAAGAPAARAHTDPSDASALSLLPVAVSVAAPSVLLVGGAVLTVVAVETSATGTVVLLERASDGARATLHLSGHVAQGAMLSIGGAVLVTAVASGWVLSTLGQAIAFIPNDLGLALLYNERITR